MECAQMVNELDEKMLTLNEEIMRIEEERERDRLREEL